MKPRVDVISGFLGAGKTTLIQEMVRAIPQGERLAVCENEFGEVGLDGETLELEGIEVLEVNAGCVCCTLSLNLVSGLKLLAARVQPTRILLEPTGLANLPDILAILRDEELRHVIVPGTAASVVDGGAMLVNYVKYKAYFDAQISAAAVLFVNRTEGLGSDEMLALADIIAGINPSAHIVPVPIAAPEIWSALDSPAVTDGAAYAGLPKSWLRQFDSLAVMTAQPGSRERLEAVLADAGFGEIVRVKGYVLDAEGHRFRVDAAGGKPAFAPAEPGGTDVVQLIGRRLKVHLIRRQMSVQ